MLGPCKHGKKHPSGQSTTTHMLLFSPSSQSGEIPKEERARSQAFESTLSAPCPVF